MGRWLRKVGTFSPTTTTYPTGTNRSIYLRVESGKRFHCPSGKQSEASHLEIKSTEHGETEVQGFFPDDLPPGGRRSSAVTSLRFRRALQLQKKKERCCRRCFSFHPRVGRRVCRAGAIYVLRSEHASGFDCMVLDAGYCCWGKTGGFVTIVTRLIRTFRLGLQRKSLSS